MFGWKMKQEKYVPMQWHESRESAWKQFIASCEKFERVVIKNGCATGYMSNDKYGTAIIIPLEMVTVYCE